MHDPDLQLNEGERNLLRAMVSAPGYEVFRNMVLAEIARFDVELANLSEQEELYEQKLKNVHLKMKAAKQFWAGLCQRIEIELKKDEPAETRKPVEKLKAEEILPDTTSEVLELR